MNQLVSPIFTGHNQPLVCFQNLFMLDWALPVWKVMLPLLWPEGRVFCSYHVSFHLPMCYESAMDCKSQAAQDCCLANTACHCRLFLLSGESRCFTQSAMGLPWSSWFTPQDAMYLHGKRDLPYHVQNEWQKPNCWGIFKPVKQRDKKEARVTVPGAKELDLRGTDHCQSTHKILGFQCVGWFWSPVFSDRDLLLPPAATRKETGSLCTSRKFLYTKTLLVAL